MRRAQNHEQFVLRALLDTQFCHCANGYLAFRDQHDGHHGYG